MGPGTPGARSIQFLVKKSPEQEKQCRHPNPAFGRHQSETLIIERAWKNPDFRREFTANPKGTIEKYTGQSLPPSLKVVVHEEDAQTMHITLPLPPGNLSELSDEDLEQVAGGTEVGPGITPRITDIQPAQTAGTLQNATALRGGW